MTYICTSCGVTCFDRQDMLAHECDSKDLPIKGKQNHPVRGLEGLKKADRA